MSFIYSILTSFMCGICLLVIGTANPIHAILLLIRIFFLGTIMLFCLQIEYYAMLFLIVYVGAIVVLFLFIIRMLELKMVNASRRISDLFSFRHLILVCLVFQVFYFISAQFFDLTAFFGKSTIDFNTHFQADRLFTLEPFTPPIIVGIFGAFRLTTYMVYTFKSLKQLFGNFVFVLPFRVVLFMLGVVSFFSARANLDTPNTAYLLESNHYINWSQLIYRTDQLRALGSILYTEYIISVILASLLLFVSMVGALAVTLFFPKNQFSVEELNSRKIQDANNQVRRNPIFSVVSK